MITQTSRRPVVRTVNPPVSLAAGVVSVFLGLAGFVRSGAGLPAGPDGFPLTMLHNIGYVAVGAALVAAGILGARQATLANTAIGVASLALFVIGLSITDAGSAVRDLLPVALGVVLTAVGLCADRPPH